MVLSAIFHTFNSHSREASEFCLMLDLGGISCSITASYISGEAKNKFLVIFRCASISCTGDRQFVNDGLIETGDWQFCMFDSSRTTHLVFYWVGIFVWSVWSFCVICNILKLSAFCIASLGRIFSLVNFSCA